MTRRASGRRPFGVVLTALLVCAVSNAGLSAVSLDGSNCVLFKGQVKRELAVCVVWTGEGRTLSISLVGRGPNQVEQIVLRRDGAEPFQTLHVEAMPPINASDVGLLYTDMNFDGHGDLAIMRRGDLSVKQPFVYLLYDAGTKRFIRSSLLEALSSVSFDAEAERVVSRWRDKVYRYRDEYRWAHRALQLVLRERRDGAGRQCARITYTWDGNRRTMQDPTPCS